MQYLLVAIGGAIGAVLRFVVSNIDYDYTAGSFPLGTFMVNISGSFLVGFLFGVSEKMILPEKFRIFAFIGVLGGYTTFSSFSLENLQLIKDKDYGMALNNVMLTNFIGLAFVFLGYFLANVIVNFYHKAG